MIVHREIRGLPVIVESPSSYRIVTPNLETIGIKSWIQFVSPAEGWTLTWHEPFNHGPGLLISSLRWPTKEAVAEYLVQLGRATA